MNYDEIFEAMYTQYRAEATIPSNTDDEYIIGMRMANEALNYWASYDGVYWRELYDTLQNNTGGTQTITTGTTRYLAPPNYKEAGGFAKVKNANGNVVQSYPIIESQEAQFRGDQDTYCYFTYGQFNYSTGTASQSGTTITGSGTTWTSAMTGMQIIWVTGEKATITFVSTTSLTADVSQTVASGTYRIIHTGWTLNLNPAPGSSLNGLDLDYVYYKKPTRYVSGSTISEISDPYMIVHRMLAGRFRSSRNPYYSSAVKDAENRVRVMQLENNSGNWADPWSLPDHSGSSWGR